MCAPPKIYVCPPPPQSVIASYGPDTSYQTVCIVEYYNHVLLIRYGSSKRREFYSIYLHLILMTPIYSI